VAVEDMPKYGCIPTLARENGAFHAIVCPILVSVKHRQNAARGALQNGGVFLLAGKDRRFMGPVVVPWPFCCLAALPKKSLANERVPIFLAPFTGLFGCLVTIMLRFGSLESGRIWSVVSAAQQCEEWMACRSGM